VAIILTTAITALLVALLDFARLVDLSVLAVSLQYLATCVAVPVLRWRRPDLPRSFRLPGGLVVPLLACGVTVWLASHAGKVELLGFGALLVLGALLALAWQWRRRSTVDS
jgi:APA family basic amino acid/polyamine antiporter